MKAILFCRVSSKEQEETGYSLPSQQKLLEADAERKKLDVVKVFSIAESAGGKKQRETFDEMMRFVKKNGVKVIVIEKADRFTRNFKDSVAMYAWLDEDEEHQLHSVKDSLILHKNSRSQEKLNWDIRVVFAKNYIDNLSEEVKKGQKEKLEQGWLPTTAPIGYKTVGEKGHRIHVIDESTAPLVKRMFEYYASGEYSLKRLTEIIDDWGLKNANNNKIVKSRVHQYLTDPFYIGINRWGGKDYHNGKQETFISNELFEQVQNVLKSKTTPRYRKHFYLFKSLIKCKECSGTVTWEVQKGHIYGHCNHYHNCNQTVWVKEPDIENQITSAFTLLELKSPRLKQWVTKALKESHKDEIEFHSSSVEELNKQHKLLKQRLDRMYEDKLDGKISESFYHSKFSQYSQELRKVDHALSTHTEASISNFQLGIDLFSLSQEASLLYQQAQMDKKRALIKLVFKELLLHEGKVEYSFSDSFEVLHKAVTQTNSSKVLNKALKRVRTFELQKKTDDTVFDGAFLQARPILLPD